MDKKNNQLIANLDHIITIEILDYDNDGAHEWVPIKTKIVRPKWWKKKVPKECGGYYLSYYGKKCKTSFEAIAIDNRENQYQVKQLNILGEGPSGTIVKRPSIVYTVAGGKYVDKHRIFFNTYEQAEEYVNNFTSECPGRFTIIR